MPATILDLLAEQVARRGDGIALRWKDGAGWKHATWRALDEDVRAIGASLIQRGVEAGDRVAIVASTRREHVLVDLAVTYAGAIPVPIYPSLPIEAIEAILRDCDARAIFVEEGVEAWKSSQAIACALDEVESMIDEGRRALAGEPELVERRARALKGEDPAAILYTSGTTGAPKGVVLSHTAFLAEVGSAFEVLGVSADDEQLLFLPLAHVFGRILLVAALRVGASTALSSSMLDLFEDAEATRPTFFGAVPRIFEKIRAVTRAKVAESGNLQSRIFAWGHRVGDAVARRTRAGDRVPFTLELQRRYADKLVSARLHARLGGRLRFAISGGAPIDADLCAWFHALGVLVLDGYGLTETTGAATVNRPIDFRFGTVGRALPGVELRVDAPAGEIGEVLGRGPTVMRGYYRRDDDTRAAIDAEGWFHTGDVGALDRDGFLRITDRKKDLLVTAGGKNVAPHAIEALIARDPIVSRAVVLGDRRPYLVALVVVDREAVRAALEVDLPDGRKLARDERVLGAVQRAIDDANARLAPFEQIRRFAVLERDLSIERGEITPTSKVRRSTLEALHAETIESLYR